MAAARRERPVVLLMSSNGTGMGHLTRLLAYQRRLGAEVDAYVVSLSQAVPVVAGLGLPYEYIPSQEATGMSPGLWQSLFAERVTELLGRVRPAVLVFDGTHPYAGLDMALAAHPGVRPVWSRRAMWRPGGNTYALRKESWFDVVLEPGDLASPADRGATVGRTAQRVRPVTLVDPALVTERAEARAALGLPADGPLALVTLGAGNINDTSDEVGAATALLHRHGVGVCVTRPSIADRAAVDGGVHAVRYFPLGRHLAAFDVAVSAAGYNSFHEHIRQGLPTVFVPNRGTRLDDQAARAQYADAMGWARTVDTLTTPEGARAVEHVLAEGGDLARRGMAADPGNGATEAAELITELALRGAR